MEVPLTREFADSFATDWIAAWNEHDLERILGHYADEIVFTSPFALEFSDSGDGVLRGRDELRRYWSQALAGLPDLRFDGPYVVAPGIDSLTIVYGSVRQLIGVEEMRLDDHGRVVEARCHYRPAGEIAFP